MSIHSPVLYASIRRAVAVALNRADPTDGTAWLRMIAAKAKLQAQMTGQDQ